MTEFQTRLKLFLDHQSALVEYAMPIVGDRGRAEDIVQEAYLRFGLAAEPGKRGINIADQVVQQPVAYLYRIVRNLALDWRRRRATEHRYAHLETTEYDLAESRQPSPEQEVSRKQLVAQCHRAFSMLDDRARRAVHMHRIDGCTLQEIAVELDVSVATAHRLIRDALVQLALVMDQQKDDAS